MTTETTIEDLRELMQICHDGALGFDTAAEHCVNTQLKSVFEQYARQREGFAQELRTEVERLGGTPLDSTSVVGTLHRGWIDLKGAVTGGDGEAIVAACETGEDHAAAAYERVVDLELTGFAHAMVERQWEAIKEAHAHILRLKSEGEKAGFRKDSKA